VTTLIQGGNGERMLCVSVTAASDSATARMIDGLRAPFDCFVINCSANFLQEASKTLHAVAVNTTDWVQVFGIACEEIHDWIDEASVRAGRQEAVGDGEPMSSWHHEVDNVSIARSLMSGGLGYESTKLIVVIGTVSDEAALIAELQREGQQPP